MNRAKWFALVLLTVLLVLAGFIMFKNRMLLFPKKHFNYSRDYQNFNIYSEQPIPDDIDTLFDQVSYRLKNVLQYQAYTYDIFLCAQPKTYAMFAQEVGRPAKTQGFNLQPLNFIFINQTFINEMNKRNIFGYQYNILEGDIVHIIAHEIVHQLIAEKIGYFNMRQLEVWKLEGFCEYAASKRKKESDPSYSFSELYWSYQKGMFDHVSAGRKEYIASMICVEYLLDYKAQDFEQLVLEQQSQKEVLMEINSQFAK